MIKKLLKYFFPPCVHEWEWADDDLLNALDCYECKNCGAVAWLSNYGKKHEE